MVNSPNLKDINSSYNGQQRTFKVRRHYGSGHDWLWTEAERTKYTQNDQWWYQFSSLDKLEIFCTTIIFPLLLGVISNVHLYKYTDYPVALCGFEGKVIKIHYENSISSHILDIVTRKEETGKMSRCAQLVSELLMFPISLPLSSNWWTRKCRLDESSSEDYAVNRDEYWEHRNLSHLAG